MNPGSQFEPPTNPYRGPFEQPTTPRFPPPPPPRRKGWIAAVVAAVVVVLLGAGAVAVLLVSGKVALPGAGPVAQTSKAPSGSGKPAAGGAAPDVCSMLPKREVDRLVPGATVSGDARDTPDSYTISFTCNWINNRISYNEFWRSREIAVRVEQHKGDGAKTGRAMAQNSYEVGYNQAKFRETAKPELRKDEKEYTSPMREIQGLGEGAFAQYVWRRSGDLLWYSYGEAEARTGDMTVKVKFQASQQPKDAKMLTSEGTKSINEENALREVTALTTHIVKGVAAWQAANPDVLAKPKTKPTPSESPKPQASVSPTPLTAFPAWCEKTSRAALTLVPEGTPRAQGTVKGQDNQTECRWLNREIPAAGGGSKLRSAMVTMHEFTNRAGAGDQGAAKGFYTSKHGGSQDMGMGAITWSKMTDVDGLGEAAFSQYITVKTGEVHSGTGSIVIRSGNRVLLVDYAGVDVPKGAKPNSAKAKLMTDREARAGALTLARAVMDALKEQPAGS